MGEPCDICGDIGVLEAILTCSQCKIARQHAYCRRTYCGDVPDVWLCEACETGNRISPKSVNEDFPRTSMPREQGSFIREKVVDSGKVRYMPTHEAIMLSSGAKELKFPPKINQRSSYVPSKIVAPMSSRIPIKPKAIPPKSSSQNVKADPCPRPAELLLPRQCNTQINLVVKHLVVQSSNDPKGKKAALDPRKKNTCKGQPMHTLLPAVETESCTKMVGEVVNKESFASSQVKHVPPIIGSGGTDCTNVESSNFEAKNGDLVNILPKTQKCFRGPALDSSWKGSFEILDSVRDKELNDGFRAHPPCKVRRKVYEFAKKMPTVLQFKMLPRGNVWTEILQDDHPDENDIGLYFFPSNSQRYGDYIFLLDFVETRDLVMRSYIDGVELFMFTSKLLSADSQRWNKKRFLWGIFRRVKTYKAEQRIVNAGLSLLSQPLHAGKENDASADNSTVDMEIDMVAGKDMGRGDRAMFSRESSTGSFGISREENANAVTLRVSKKLDYGIQKPLPLLEVKKDLLCDIPPGFQQTHQQKSEITTHVQAR